MFDTVSENTSLLIYLVFQLFVIYLLLQKYTNKLDISGSKKTACKSYYGVHQVLLKFNHRQSYKNGKILIRLLNNISITRTIFRYPSVGKVNCYKIFLRILKICILCSGRKNVWSWLLIITYGYLQLNVRVFRIGESDGATCLIVI
jgi:hypothetical protein